MLPYVMHSIQELSVVDDLSHWANLNVQFIGKLTDCDGAFVCGCIEKNSPATIAVDFSLTSDIPPRNSTVRIWGELELSRNTPLVKVKISRTVQSVDIPLYRKSLIIRYNFTPRFATIKRT